MNKTIVYAGEFQLPDKSASANRVVSNGRIFKKLGYAVYFLGASASDEAFDGIRQSGDCEEMYEQAHPSSSLQWAKHIFNPSEIRELVKKTDADTVILYNLPFVTFLQIKYAFRKSGKKIVYDCTEWTSYTDGGLPKKIFKRVDEWFIRNMLPYFSDNIIVISEMMLNKYKSCKNVIKLPPLVDTDNSLWHQTPYENSDVFEFCFAGVPDGKKESPHKIVRAFNKIKNDNIRLKIVGITKNEFLTMYPEEKEKANDERISFLGKVSHDEAVRSIISCDCYIFIRPSDRRNNAGFPTKFAEAYTLSCPMIATDISDIASYYTENADSILLKDENEDKIKSAMEKMISGGKQTKPREINKAFDYKSFADICREFLTK